ncbi:MAG: NAD(P)H-binding protein [Acidimicrobiia bacterium]|nr:NAD(P)H-binding protein [Acidimicrobiia bacterium]
MPVIVVGADTPIGAEIVGRLAGAGGEVRAFITDPQAGEELRRRGCKVAIGDVSDGSHVEMAALECFTAVLVAESAGDDRERAFAGTPGDVAVAWMEAVQAARIHRLIWVGSPAMPEPPVEATISEVAVVSAEDKETAAEVVRLNELETLP